MAGKGTVVSIVSALVEPVIDGLGFDLVDTEYVKEGPNWFLRLYVDKPGGITIDDCQLVHESVTDIIDEADPISGPYIFEVSSPGLDRPLKTEKDILRNVGELVEVSLYAPDEGGKKNYEGTIKGCENGRFELEISGSRADPKAFDLKSVALIKKVIRFDRI